MLSVCRAYSHKKTALNPSFIISCQGAWGVWDSLGLQGDQKIGFKVSKPTQIKLKRRTLMQPQKQNLGAGNKWRLIQLCSSFLSGGTLIPSHTPSQDTKGLAAPHFCFVCIPDGHKNTRRHLKRAARVRSGPAAEQLRPEVPLNCCSHPRPL